MKTALANPECRNYIVIFLIDFRPFVFPGSHDEEGRTKITTYSLKLVRCGMGHLDPRRMDKIGV
jgi:hypothetical protein